MNLFGPVMNGKGQYRITAAKFFYMICVVAHCYESCALLFTKRSYLVYIQVVDIFVNQFRRSIIAGLDAVAG